MKRLLIAGLIALGALVAAPAMAQSYNHPVTHHPVHHAPAHHRRPPPHHRYHHPVHHPVHH